MKILRFLYQKKWIVLALLVLTGVGIYWRARAQNKDDEIKTIQPTRQTLVNDLSVSGTIDAYEKAQMRFPTYSKLAWVGVNEGDSVRKWQALASVDTSTLRKQLAQDLNDFNKEFRDHDQTLDDYGYYDAPNIDKEMRRILEKAQFDLDNAVIDVEIRDLAIKLSTISSPIGGIVTRVDQKFPGVTVAPTDLIEVVNPATLYFSAVVDEEDISAVNEGQPAQLTLDAFADTILDTTVERIDFTPSTSEGGGTGYKVRFKLPPEASRYRLGMNGTVDITLASVSDVLTIPSEALIIRDNVYYVDILRDGKKERVEIATGMDTGDLVEVTGGIDETSLVVLPTSN